MRSGSLEATFMLCQDVLLGTRRVFINLWSYASKIWKVWSRCLSSSLLNFQRPGLRSNSKKKMCENLREADCTYTSGCKEWRRWERKHRSNFSLYLENSTSSHHGFHLDTFRFFHSVRRNISIWLQPQVFRHLTVRITGKLCHFLSLTWDWNVTLSLTALYILASERWSEIISADI